ncbi:hypothetical protein VTI28DRAFT_7539 [Corynascus sepedonium]
MRRSHSANGKGASPAYTISHVSIVYPLPSTHPSHSARRYAHQTPSLYRWDVGDSARAACSRPTICGQVTQSLPGNRPMQQHTVNLACKSKHPKQTCASGPVLNYSVPRMRVAA